MQRHLNGNSTMTDRTPGRLHSFQHGAGRRLAFLLMLVSLACGCAPSTVVETRAHQTHATGTPVTAGVGTPMQIREQGSVEKQRRWVGILNSHDGWETLGTRYSDDYTREELVYLGRTGTQIEIGYRLFRPGSAVPERQETVSLDPAAADIITVRGFRLRVLEADADKIRFIVLK